MIPVSVDPLTLGYFPFDMNSVYRSLNLLNEVAALCHSLYHLLTLDIQTQATGSRSQQYPVVVSLFSYSTGQGNKSRTTR